MADENLESGQVEGNEGVTNPPVSQTPGDKPPSTFDADKLLDQLRVTIVEEVGRAVQSTKDKRFSEIEKTLGNFQPVLERFKDIVSPEQLQQVQRDLEWEEVKRRVFEQTGEPASAGNTAQAPAVDTAKVIRESGLLDMNDPKVALLASKRFATETEVYAEIAKHLQAQRNAPSPTAAQQLADTGGSPQSGDYHGLSDDELGAKLESLAMVDPRGSAEERTRIIAELERRDKQK